MKPFAFIATLLAGLLSASNQLPFLVDGLAKAVACSRNPQLHYCRVQAEKEHIHNHQPSRTVVLASRQRVEEDVGGSKDNNDQTACRELRVEYTKSCTAILSRAKDSDEFCSAYENVCFDISKEKPDQQVVGKNNGRSGEEIATTDGRNRFQTSNNKNSRGHPMLSLSKSLDSTVSEEDTLPPPNSMDNAHLRTLPPSRHDYSLFCAEYKQRFLYVCPDPFRFGQRAAVFCPIYSERCKVSLPDKPVVPTPHTPIRSLANQVDSMCGQYRSFAANYCANPFALLQNNVRQGCDKYWRFCTNNNANRFG